jgi:branched-chain amino acid transport system ATP-binding protein
MTPERAVLDIQDLVVGYRRDLQILRGVSLAVPAGAVIVVLGANGVGKSTLLKAVFGALRPLAGDVLLDGRSLLAVPVHHRARLGMGYLAQQPSVFPAMTVEENLLVGAWTLRRDGAEVRRRLAEAYARFPLLAERRSTPVGSLSGGQQRMVELARTLIPRPRLLLADEPTAGLALQPAADVYRQLAALRDSGLTLLLVDQNIRGAMTIADHVAIIDLGRVRAGGPVADFPDIGAAVWGATGSEAGPRSR